LLVAKQISHDYSYHEEPVVSRKRRGRKAGPVQEKLILVGCIFLAVITGLMLAATHAQITDRNANIIQVKQEISDLQNANERLKLEIARLKSLDRIENIAMTQLGMVEPGIEDIQYVAFDDKNGSKASDTGTLAQGESKAVVEVNKADQIHPILLAVNKIIANYALNGKQPRTEQINP